MTAVNRVGEEYVPFEPGQTVLARCATQRRWRPATLVAVPTVSRSRYRVQFTDEAWPTEAELTFFDLDRIDGQVTRPTTETETPRAPVTALGGEEHVPEVDPAAQLGAVLATLASHVPVDPETPGRMLRALRELTEGYEHDLTDPDVLRRMLRSFPREGGDAGLVLVRSVPFASLCEHHVLPFTGTVDVAYLPSAQIVGLSKIPRLVRAVTRRLQVQERIGQMVGDAMDRALSPVGVMVVVRGRHSCMALRGAESPGEMVTSYVLGAFRKDPAARAEALALLNG